MASSGALGPEIWRHFGSRNCSGTSPPASAWHMGVRSADSSNCRTVLSVQAAAGSVRGAARAASSSSAAAMFWMSYESDLRRLLCQFYLPQATSSGLPSPFSRDADTSRSLDSVEARASRAGTQIPTQILKGAGRIDYGGDDWTGPSGWRYGGDGREPSSQSPPFRVEAPGQRIIAIGDLHGDFEVAKEALRLGGVLSESTNRVPGACDDNLRWSGGNTMVVQVGDILDRGDDELAILSLLRHLDTQARAEGGRVFQLNGNHETMNVALEFRYVTDGGFRECEHLVQFCEGQCNGDWQTAFREWWRESQTQKRQNARSSGWPVWNPLQMRRMVNARTELFRVGGPIAMELGRHGVALLINDTLFAHGGVLPHHVDHGLAKMNEEVSRWMRRELSVLGEPEPMPFIATRGFDSIVWSRLYSQEFFASPDDLFKACSVLTSALDATGAARLVVGHTPQLTGANSACHGRVWRIDVGMSSGMMGAPAQVLEINGNSVRILGGETEKRLQSARAG